MEHKLDLTGNSGNMLLQTLRRTTSTLPRRARHHQQFSILTRCPPPLPPRRPCSPCPSPLRSLLFSSKRRTFSQVGTSGPRPVRHIPSLLVATSLVAGGVAALTEKMWRSPIQIASVTRLEMPVAEFEHPYDKKPWVWRVWFTAKRLSYLVMLWIPCGTVAFAAWLTGDGDVRARWLRLMVQTIEWAGCSFQKFGQWLSMRPDILPPDVICALSELQDSCAKHGMEHNRSMFRTSFGAELEEIFEFFDHTAIASASVGQVHRGRLRPQYAMEDGSVDVAVNYKFLLLLLLLLLLLMMISHYRYKLLVIILFSPGYVLTSFVKFIFIIHNISFAQVKVRHPGVLDETWIDTMLIFFFMDHSNGLLTMPFSEKDFTYMLQKQFDFEWEAYNMSKFAENFSSETGSSVLTFPAVSGDLLSPSVLVESWGQGKSVESLFSSVGENWEVVQDTVNTSLMKTKKELATIVFDMNMKMFLRDNFIHGDLHAGNLLYDEKSGALTVLDAGLISQIPPQMNKHFVLFIQGMCSGDAAAITDQLLMFDNRNDVPGVVNVEVQNQKDELLGTVQSACNHWVDPVTGRAPDG